MNLKTFAQESRKLLMEGVAKRLLYWGFDEKGEVLEEPQKISGGYLLRGEPFNDLNVPGLWSALKSAIDKKGIEVVVEEAAYTWFNRMMAMKILAKNGYDDALLDYVDGMQHTPLLLQRARQGHYGFLDTKEKERLQKMISDYTKDQEAFALLLKGYCNSHNTLKRVFGKSDDYTELLLPDNMLQNDGFLHLLNTTDAITDEDYQTVELIGWLYQFYISEKKDEVFASFKKNKKAEAKDIPAATQIFTPNWIVKYMVENTAGKIWLDKHPDSALKGKMKYLVENESNGQNEPIISEVEDLTLMDPACGSGHILVEGFDLLYQMYMEEYYTPEEAVESILKKNIFGLDIDDRAAQLSNFAILLKAAKVYPDVWTKDVLPQVYAMPDSKDFSQQELKDFLGIDGLGYLEELDDAVRLMKQAKNLGSIMKLKLSVVAQDYIAQRFAELKADNYRNFNVEAVFQSIQQYIPVLLLLTKKYSSVVANPPYMGSGNMNSDLKNYVFANYPNSKSDLFAVFMESTMTMLVNKGLMGMINQHAWMFLSSFENLRNQILNNYGILNMLHLGARTFEELSGERVQSTAFVLTKSPELEFGNYFRLVSFKTGDEKHSAFLRRDNLFSQISKAKFSRLPKRRLGYWLSETLTTVFEDSTGISSIAYSDGKNVTGNVSKYIRYHWEISATKIGMDIHWFKISKGGIGRKYYGNVVEVIDWSQEARDHYKSSKVGRIIKQKLWSLSGITWSKMKSKNTSFRLLPSDTTFDEVNITFKNEADITPLLGLLNSKVLNNLVQFLNPTTSLQIENILEIPIPNGLNRTQLELVTSKQIDIAKRDWDSREISLDFKRSALLNEVPSLEEGYQIWQEKVTEDFFQMYINEEELNRLFIDVYGLQDELTPEVALKDITILQAELDRKELERLEPIFREKGQEAIELPINKGEVISQFISYAIGLFMGRYRLDKPGLNIAHPNPWAEELASYTYNGRRVTIDEDAIVPLMGSKCRFNDDALNQFHELLDTIWGHETRTENINFIQECLDKDLEKFLVKDFYKYHCGMYKKKPIYWLFSSKKGAFQVLVYMHRMNAFTAEKIRANYLLEHIKYLRKEEDLLSANESNLNTQEARKLDQIRKDIAECEAYDLELKNIADQQIEIDLDDGVTVNYAKFQSVLAKIK